MRMASPWMISERLSGIGSHQTQVNGPLAQRGAPGLTKTLCPWQAWGPLSHLHPECVELCQLVNIRVHDTPVTHFLPSPKRGIKVPVEVPETVTEDIDDVGGFCRVVTFEVTPEERRGCGQ